MDDEPFLRTILDNPDDDAPRLVYADWLEEQGAPTSSAKAEFLRLTEEMFRWARDAEAMTQGPPDAERLQARVLELYRAYLERLGGGPRGRLKQLAGGLDPKWLAVVSRRPVENCSGPPAPDGRTPPRPRIFFRFECPRRWESLIPTDDRAVRHCDSCGEAVHYCETIDIARRHAAQGHCVAVDLRVDRRAGDLISEPPSMTLGMLEFDPSEDEPAPPPPDPAPTRRERRGGRRGGR